MLFVAVVIAKIISPELIIIALLAYKLSTRPYHVLLWAIAYVAINEWLLHQIQITRRIDPLSLFAAAVAFAIVYGSVYWVAKMIKKRKS